MNIFQFTSQNYAITCNTCKVHVHSFFMIWPGLSIHNHGGGGVTCHDFGYGCVAGVPEPHPIHIPGQVKNMTHSYTSHIENWPHSYTIFENWPHSYTIFHNFTHSYTFFGDKDTPLIYFWCKNDVKMVSIHILGGLKSIPHSSRTSVYTFIMEVTPPPCS